LQSQVQNFILESSTRWHKPDILIGYSNSLQERVVPNCTTGRPLYYTRPFQALESHSLGRPRWGGGRRCAMMTRTMSYSLMGSEKPGSGSNIPCDAAAAVSPRGGGPGRSDGPERQPPERPLLRRLRQHAGSGNGLLLQAQHVPHHLHVLVPAGLHVLVKAHDSTLCMVRFGNMGRKRLITAYCTFLLLNQNFS